MGKGVKASSGLSAVRNWTEEIVQPPNTFTLAALTYATAPRHGLGQKEVRAGVTNGGASPGTLRVLGAWLAAGPYVILESMATAVDTLSGLSVADLLVCQTRPFIVVDFVATGAPGLTAAFELGAYFMPR